MNRHGLWLLAILCAVPLWAADDVVMKAMRDELARSVERLKDAQLDTPYFIAYRVRERQTQFSAATLGSLLQSNRSHSRWFAVEVRVGTAALDNTNFVSSGFQPFVGTVQLPLDSDYQELRRNMWLSTDAAFKQAVENLARKRSALQNRNRTEDLPDFSPRKPATGTDERPAATVPLVEMERLVRDLSAVFRNQPGVDNSQVSAGIINATDYYVNSEGSSFTRTVPQVVVNGEAGTQAADGMPLEDYYVFYARDWKSLPSRDALLAQTHELTDRLARLRDASPLERYNGPVLFEAQAAAEIFAQAFAPRLLAARRPFSDNPNVERAVAAVESPFLDKLGSRVLPDSLSVTDDPTATLRDGAVLFGGYQLDDDGIRAERKTLVENGELKTLLATRVPVRGIAEGSGNRRGSSAMPSNLIVTAAKGLDEKELRAEFLKLVAKRGREFGVVVRRVGNPAFRFQRELMATLEAGNRGEDRVEPAILAFKIYPDGREELIRNAQLAGVSAAAFRDIVAVSQTAPVYTAPFSSRGVGFSVVGGTTPNDVSVPLVSWVVPSMILDDVTVRKPAGEIPKPPLVPRP